MKKVIAVLSAGVFLVLLSGCSDTKDRYVDLSTGKPVELEKNEKTGLLVSKETGEPVYIYVDTKKDDTIYGKTGKVINGHVVKGSNNDYVYDEDEKLKNENGETKYKDGDYKVEVEKDGDIKIKDGDKKTKIEGETGDRKVKND